MKFELIPFKDIEEADGRYRALSADATFEIRFARKVPSGAWLRWRYRTSYLDHLVRPQLCLELPHLLDTFPMAAPLFGEASWIGQIPADCQRIFLKPVDRAGHFSFEIMSCRKVPKALLMPRAFKKSPFVALQSVGAGLIMAPRESRQALLYARKGVPLEEYGAWRQRHMRSYAPSGFDRPYAEDARSPHFEILVFNDRRESKPLGQSPLVASLLAQSAQNWRCTFIGFPHQERLADRTSFRFLAQGDDLAWHGLDDSKPFVVRLTPDDSLAPYALAALGRAIAQSSPADIAYADEDEVDAAGLRKVRLKPDWSPVFERAAGYLGRAVFWNTQSLLQARIGIDADFDTPSWRREALERLVAPRVEHLRRVILSSPAMPVCAPSRRAPPDPESLLGTVRIIVPSKDMPDLIRPCLAGLAALPEQDRLKIVVVDNGSTDPAVLALYLEHARRPNFQVIKLPEKFNYSRMCNQGAACSREDVLLFLNNDVSMPNTFWLAPLVRLAMRANTGAVGARLLFPSGKLQHVGVTLGMGGYAAHQYDNAEPDEPGYLERLVHPHELSAVTGACVAVERQKFEKVGGFDESNLPVELNDIDLCLRLNRVGYQTLFAPEAELIHHQSASRSFSYRPFTRYERERNWFKSHWEKEVRDDPFFHPAFSLYSTRVALDG